MMARMSKSSGRAVLAARPRAVLTRQQYYEIEAPSDALLSEVSPEWTRCIYGHDALNARDLQSLARQHNGVVGEAWGWSADYVNGHRCDECVGFNCAIYGAAQKFGIARVRAISEEFARHFLKEHAGRAAAVADERSERA